MPRFQRFLDEHFGKQNAIITQQDRVWNEMYEAVRGRLLKPIGNEATDGMVYDKEQEE